jgi:proteasome alpha subunit
MGGSAEQISGDLQERYQEGQGLSEALQVAVGALGRGRDNGESRQLTPGQLEVAVLDRTRPLRKFKRILGPQLAQLLDSSADGTAPGDESPGGEIR